MVPRVADQEVPPRGATVWTRPRLVLAVGGLLALHWSLAVASLLRENPTIDEVAHLPAGVSYWEKKTFRLYPHNPPLIKMAAAWPVIRSGAGLGPIYDLPSWRQEPPNHASIAHEFAVLHAGRYFELFARARLVIPFFSLIGGAVVFAWSRRLYGPAGGVLSLALWAICPNLLAHGRLVTTDAGATALGVAATYLFWRYLHRPTWARAAGAGAALGVACLAKFSMLLLFGIWPVIWLAWELIRGPGAGFARRLGRAVIQSVTTAAIAVLVIDCGYGFEGVFRPLKSFEFASDLLTREQIRGDAAPQGPNAMVNFLWRHRVNRFRGNWLGSIPAPLPRWFLIGFDLQKCEAEGVPRRYVDPNAKPGEVKGYPVYLDGQIRQSGWWYYYFAALAYKVPEGTTFLVVLSWVVLVAKTRARAAWADEVAVGLVPIVVMLAMSFGTDINLGLRYVLPIFPYLFIAVGKLAPWAAGLGGRAPIAARVAMGGALAMNAAATAAIHPHYLAYFNWVSGGPSRGSEHLIDSNLDWGQDLVTLRDWLARNARGEKVGLAYFGQINPNLLALRGEGFDWFVPPWLPGSVVPVNPGWKVEGPPDRLRPGLYAVSASFVRGLPFAFYDSSLAVPSLYPAWDGRNAPRPDPAGFTYFQSLRPIARVGSSIFVYRVTEEHAARLAGLWP